ncbi:MAG: hypothetical protein K6T65_01605 [Peptococcaceae bacterium]|nr:hypothetical protein [Peptococcaceae bacterium]
MNRVGRRVYPVIMFHFINCFANFIERIARAVEKERYVNNVTGCMYKNVGHNGCTFPGESSRPLEEEEAQALRRLSDYCTELTDEVFIHSIRELGYTKAVVLPETRRVILSSILRVKNGCSEKSRISLNENCVEFLNCIGKKVSCDFCRDRKERGVTNA